MNYDVIIIGAGGAGMMCAIHAGKRGRKVLLLDHATKLGGKILISGGGRCNFTNKGTSPDQYISQNIHFCKSALTRYRPERFIQMVQEHGIAFHEKKLGQLFCDGSAQAIVKMLQAECEKSGAEFKLGCKIWKISRTENPKFLIETLSDHFTCQSLVIATGGLSLPKLGATGFGYEIARQFGLKTVEPVPALDGFVFGESGSVVGEKSGLDFSSLSGVSVDCIAICNGVSFRENILFTHTGLSGPAALQASLHWRSGDSLFLNLLPEVDSFSYFMEKKREGSRTQVKNLLGELLPGRVADFLCARYFPSELPLPQVSEKALEIFCQTLHGWKLQPHGTVGYGKAEVTRGGVDTDELSSKTMEAKKSPGLYFIGEVVDVTGWLGGYNFHWAWASGWSAGQVV